MKRQLLISCASSIVLSACGVVQLNGKPLGGGSTPAGGSLDSSSGSSGSSGSSMPGATASRGEDEALSSAPRGPMVADKFPQFYPADSYDLAKVAEAMKLVTPDMIVHTRSEIDRNDYHPSPLIDHSGPARRQACTGTGPLAAFEAYVSEDEQNGPFSLHLSLGNCTRDEPVRRGVPGVMWAEDKHTESVVFVTFDGGRYNVDPKSLNPGTVPKAHWPAMLDPFLGEWHAQQLVAIGQHDAEEPLTKAADAEQRWSSCATPLARKSSAEVDAVGGPGSSDDHQARRDAIAAKYTGQIATACGPIKTEFAAVWAGYLGRRLKQRQAIFTEAAARLAR
jgi:hypothetical protein